MSIVKKRLSPEESRSAALEAARQILVETGPAAVTLKAVAARIDRTHANLLHHFGSAAGLQKALAAYQAETVCATIGKKMAESAPGDRNVREIVDLAFDAFNEGGAGALATWMAATGNDDALDPIVDAIHRLIDGMAPDAHEKRLMHEDTLALVLMALGDAQLGGPMAEALDLPRDTSRVLATELITGRIAKFWAEHGGKPGAEG
ncbi:MULTISPECIES: TetR/AcrR family transcriptional regulator [unclassified Sphingopyxis]|jgi:AcrR family transcriptional regulator|uniref:TetR/AcrR family transcriptional regulator n=1 Tax=unclassified Sphingopyxis TaxID=2614943 RepID=UPI0007838C3B|nr:MULTISPECIES: TetR family transcriptional regulator [unclassified Sphingopyxis]USI76024.1 TetR/AcrR family transcriptional regulator [Sphingopyxis sp. USTB-05]